MSRKLARLGVWGTSVAVLLCVLSVAARAFGLEVSPAWTSESSQRSVPSIVEPVALPSIAQPARVPAESLERTETVAFCSVDDAGSPLPGFEALFLRRGADESDPRAWEVRASPSDRMDFLASELTEFLHLCFCRGGSLPAIARLPVSTAESKVVFRPASVLILEVACGANPVPGVRYQISKGPPPLKRETEVGSPSEAWSAIGAHPPIDAPEFHLRLESVTDGNGRAEFRGLSLGSYEIRCVDDRVLTWTGVNECRAVVDEAVEFLRLASCYPIAAIVTGSNDVILGAGVQRDDRIVCAAGQELAEWSWRLKRKLGLLDKPETHVVVAGAVVPSGAFAIAMDAQRSGRFARTVNFEHPSLCTPQLLAVEPGWKGPTARIAVDVVSPSGRRLNGVPLLLQERDTSTHYPARSGTLRVLPIGVYSIGSLDQVFADLTTESSRLVDASRDQSVQLATRHEWVHAEIAVRFADGSSPRQATVRWAHAETKLGNVLNALVPARVPLCLPVGRVQLDAGCIGGWKASREVEMAIRDETTRIELMLQR